MFIRFLRLQLTQKNVNVMSSMTTGQRCRCIGIRNLRIRGVRASVPLPVGERRWMGIP